jgi:hypothetical protein
LGDVGDTLRHAGVAAVYLVHGTFVGPDALGLLGELGRLFPSVAGVIRGLVKQTVECMTGDAGNYTTDYQQALSSGINPAGAVEVPVRLFQWSSENHHVGRADGAVRLIDELAALELLPGQRILLWGHSHAGNVFALLSHLLSGDDEAVSQFFEAARVYYRWPLVGCVDIPHWYRVETMLAGQRHPLIQAPLDIVTFGTPIRYGWDPAGYDKLLHFVNHRPAAGVPEYCAPFPPKVEHVLEAADGDYIQQFGIAGTDVPPHVTAWRAWWAEGKLDRLLEPHFSPRNLPEILRAGTRVPQAGTTLLVDYGRPSGTIAEHHAGHAVYTRKEWMLFHAEQVAKRFYGE